MNKRPSVLDKKAVLAQKLDDARDEGRQEGIQIGEERRIKIGAENGKLKWQKTYLRQEFLLTS